MMKSLLHSQLPKVEAASPVVPTVTVADQPVEGLSTDQPVLYHKLAYGATLSEVKALDENAQVTVIQANEANGMRASIYCSTK